MEGIEYIYDKHHVYLMVRDLPEDIQNAVKDLKDIVGKVLIQSISEWQDFGNYKERTITVQIENTIYEYTQTDIGNVYTDFDHMCSFKLRFVK